MQETPSELAASIRERYERVVAEIRAAAKRAGRREESVRLVVVTKAQPLSVVKAAIEAGARILGENYAEEAAAKIDALRLASTQPTSGRGAGPTTGDAPRSVEWHMIGHIQSRKVKLVVPNFDLIHSLDSLKLAQRLDSLGREFGRPVGALLEFNIGGEAGKQGWSASADSEWPRLLDEIAAVTSLPNLRVHGLMTMPPLAPNPEDSREYFSKLRRLRDFLAARLTLARWDELSMGTSADFAVAVEEGATFVRVGEGILGSRPVQEMA